MDFLQFPLYAALALGIRSRYARSHVLGLAPYKYHLENFRGLALYSRFGPYGPSPRLQGLAPSGNAPVNIAE